MCSINAETARLCSMFLVFSPCHYHIINYMFTRSHRSKMYHEWLSVEGVARSSARRHRGYRCWIRSSPWWTSSSWTRCVSNYPPIHSSMLNLFVLLQVMMVMWSFGWFICIFTISLWIQSLLLRNMAKRIRKYSYLFLKITIHDSGGRLLEIINFVILSTLVEIITIMCSKSNSLPLPLWSKRYL
jgi:hypothetical protein